ncbi:unnamed protein product, partial [Rotaria sp. Silwood2]
MIPIQESQNEQWDLFENAATYSSARSILQKNKNNDTLTTNHGKSSKTLTTMNLNVEKITVGQHKTLENLYELMSTFQSVISETRQELKEVLKLKFIGVTRSTCPLQSLSPNNEDEASIENYMIERQIEKRWLRAIPALTTEGTVVQLIIIVVQ